MESNEDSKLKIDCTNVPSFPSGVPFAPRHNSNTLFGNEHLIWWNNLTIIEQHYWLKQFVNNLKVQPEGNDSPFNPIIRRHTGEGLNYNANFISGLSPPKLVRQSTNIYGNLNEPSDLLRSVPGVPESIFGTNNQNDSQQPDNNI
jgi:hypothetical protein